MPDAGARGLVRPAALVASGLLLLLAHGSLLSSPFRATDYARLLGGSGGLAAAWDALSAAAWGVPRPGSRVATFRVEHLLALLVLALAVSSFLRRLLAPWLGATPARSASVAVLVLLPLHPGAVQATSQLAARGELAGITLGALAAALFLRGRQDEHDGIAAAGLACLGLAALAAPVALVLVPLLAGAELLSARRHRPLRARVRTTATTCALAAVAALLPRLFADAAQAAPAADARTQVVRAFAELGRLAIPVGERPALVAVAGAVVLLLLGWQPALRAARNAPRLWSGLFLGWSAALALGLYHASTTEPGAALLALLVWTSGLATALTARRSRGAARVAVVAIGWALLAHAGTRALPESARAQARLARAVAERAPSSAGSVLVLQPRVDPDEVRDFGWLFHPRTRGAGADGAEDFDPARVRVLAEDAFPYLAMGPSFAALRSRELAVLVAERALDAGGDGLLSVSVPPAPAVRAELPPWGATLEYRPPEPLDPFRVERVRIVAELSIPPEHLGRLAWAGRSGVRAADAYLTERGGRRVAEFDLARTLPWLLAGGVRSMVLELGVRKPERGELIERLDGLESAGTPAADGDDWIFDAPGGRGVDPDGRFALALLAPAGSGFVELLAEREPDGRLRFHGAERFARAHGAPVEWTLEYRIGPHAVARSRGSVPRP